MVNRFSKLRRLSWVLSLTFLVTNPLWADDTEIFFGRSSNVDVQPNVLFVLDGSGSMAWYDCANGTVKSWSCGDGTLNGTTTRLARLKDALKVVLNNTSNVNVGLMRFSGTDSGGRITYPIKNIDQQMCNGEPCGDDTLFSAQSKAASSADDAVQHMNGDVVLNEPTISLTKYDNSSTENQWVGLRFPELQIPQGATITDARLDFSSVSDSNSTANLTIHSEDTTDAEPYINATNNIGQRSRSYNTVSWNSIPKWEKEGNYESPNIANLVQLVVNKTGWCGGNAFGLLLKGNGARQIAAFDTRAGTSPTLRVSYKLDQVPASGGCTATTLLARVSSGQDDATELSYDGRGYSTGLTYSVFPVAKSTYYSYGYDSAVRFSGVEVPKNAKIIDASITLITQNHGWFATYPTLKVTAHNSANPPALQARNGNISNRPETAAVNWTNIPTASNIEATTPSLQGIVQGLVDKTDWDSGNPMVFMVKQAGNGGHNFVSFDGNPSKAALLKIKFESQIQNAQDKINGPVTNVRSEIIAKIDSMVASGGTPTVGAMLEAKRYFSGQPVRYGLKRLESSTYAKSPYYWGRYSRVSAPESYTGGNVVRSASCNTNAPDGRYCSTEQITGQPVYVSPFTHECQTNHVVLLTDGQPTADSTAANSVRSLVPGGCVEQSNGEGTCGEEIAEHMNTTDQHTFGGDQFITTHTIGFNFTTQWLKNIAAAGGGGYYTADTADQLSAALANIIDSVQDESTSFVAPGATVDNFSKVSHRSDIYLALFQPKATPDWDGNLKRYDFSGNPAKLHDTNSQLAIDPDTGKFYDTTQSHWSATADGNSVARGGAAGRMLPTERNVYTYSGSNNNLTHATNRFATNNGLITTAQLGLNSSETATRANILNWALGHDIKDEDGDQNLSEPRYHIGDPLHSRPVIITYGGDSDDPDSVIYFGTNDGFLHAISTDTGDEVFSFIPSELISNLKPLYESNPATNKIYGLDGSMSLWTEDKNNNGSIESGDHVYLYAGMRRGGHSYYALDITDKDYPEFKWQISDATSGFGELGQTWSQALPTSINYLGTKTKVLVFGGGYDTDQDDHVTRTVDDIGRAIYIVDAEDGDLLWSGGPTGGAETKSFDDMLYSFPATPQAVDANGDGMAEQLYIGDMGGRIWRFDVNENTNEQNKLIDGGIIADLGTDGIIADNRRFYHTPDISVSNVDGEKFINIAVGSGYQAHPLDTAIEDRFYLIRYPFDSPVDEDGNLVYGIIDTTIAGGLTGSSQDVDKNYTPILEEDLFNATSNVIGEGSAAEVATAEQALAASRGWYIKMDQEGEKVLGSSVTFDNKVLFASYVPGGAATGCAPEIGHGIFWAVNLWDATPATALDGSDDDNLVKADRTKPIPGGGLPAPIQTLFIESGSDDPTIDDTELQILAISGANSMMTLDSKELVQRVYWSEYPNF